MTISPTKGTPLIVVARAALPVATPSNPVYLPDPNGLPLPQGITTWEIGLDQALVPQDEPVELHVEYLYAGGWQHDAGAVLSGGSFTDKQTGLPTTQNRLASFVGPGVVSGFVPPNPTAVRIRVDQSRGRIVTLSLLVDGITPRSLLVAHHSTAHVQTKDAQVASGTSVAVSLTLVGAGNHLCASTVGGTNAASDPLAPTSSPVATWSNAIAGFASNGGFGPFGRMDYSENVASGSWTVTCKSNSSTAITGIVSESSGVATSASLGAVNHAASNANVASLQPGSITPASGSILYTATGDDGANTAADTIDSGFTISSDATAWNGSNTRAGQAHKDNVTAVAVNPTWTLPGAVQQMIAMIAEFKAAAGAPSSIPNKIVQIKQAVNRAYTY